MTKKIDLRKQINIVHDDCLKGMKKLKDNSVDLVCIDPPYNIGKDKSWDKWKTVDGYVQFMGEVFKECERVLKPDGSFYFFHNDMSQVSHLMVWLEQNTELNLKQFNVWDKYRGTPKSHPYKGAMWKQVNSGGKRRFSNAKEYCLFYTFADTTGLKEIDNDLTLYKPIRDYFKEERTKTTQTYKEINKKCFNSASNGGGMASNILTSYKKGWTFPTKEKYEALQKIGICKKPYSKIKKEYEELRQEYESERYTFNQPDCNLSIWQYPIPNKEERQKHPTQKPISLMEHIIKTSSNEGDIVLDCFGGSGSTAVACKNLNRKCIIIEREEKYIKIIKDRLENE